MNSGTVWGLILIVLMTGSIHGTDTDHGSEPESEALALQTIITSREMTFDYREGTAKFDGDVNLTDPEMRLESDTLLVVFNQDGDVERIEAEGHVRIWQDGRKGYCEAAVYTARDGLIRMMGAVGEDAASPARLMSGADTIFGEEIRIYIHQEKITALSSKLVIFPDENPGGATGLNRLRIRSQD